MASTTGPSLAHRTLSNVRTGGSSSPGGQAQAGPSSPHTPLRTVPSAFGSPSSLRAEDDTIVIEFGARKVRVGFAGDAVPKAVVGFGPEQHRRVGDFRTWQPGYHDDWRKRAVGKDWGKDCELWQLDVRGLDLGLVADKLERGLRDAFLRHLLIDSRPRKMAVVLPSDLPIPLLSTILDTLFGRFQSPTVSLLSAPVMTAVAAGLRSALVVDLGWAETVVTSVYEYREVLSSRSIRGGRMLVEHVHRLLARSVSEKRGATWEEDPDKPRDHIVSFDECEDVAARMLWCRPASSPASPETAGLPTLTETDESGATISNAAAGSDLASIPLRSTFPPVILDVPHDQLSEPCENTFFEKQYSQASWDDDELPVHLLLFRHLLQLPVDVRGIGMSRIVFTGGCSNILGLRGRIIDELAQLVSKRGWDAVDGRAVERRRENANLQRRGSRPASNGPTSISQQTTNGGAEADGVWHDAANATPEFDPVEEQVNRKRDRRPRVQGQLRAVDTLGAWSGASLLTQLRVPAIATVDREVWLQQGAAGASRVADVDLKAQQRQSMGPGGLMRGAAAGTNWTLGAWGSV